MVTGERRPVALLVRYRAALSVGEHGGIYCPTCRRFQGGQPPFGTGYDTELALILT